MGHEAIFIDMLHALSKKKIFFGHQSVGENIINGISIILNNYPDINFNILKIDSDKQLPREKSFFAHSRIGVNQNPKSKIDAFFHLMSKGMAQHVDIAFFKFCYVDIHQGTPIKNLFTHYEKSMKKLSEQHPDTTFIHVTVPLESQQTGIKKIIKKILSKPLRGDNNKYREQFNKIMRTHYTGKEPLFDLARLESSAPGQEETKPALLPIYTEDGGHLNNLGSKVIAEKLLEFLVSL